MFVSLYLSLPLRLLAVALRLLASPLCPGCMDVDRDRHMQGVGLAVLLVSIGKLHSF